MSSTDLPDSTASALPTAEALFDHWLQARGNDAWTPLTAEAAKPYRFIWGAWSKYLLGQCVPAVAWHEASAVEVLHFINHIPQTVKGRKISDITRRRYWRVLDRVYDHALLNGWIEINPVHAVARGERPPSEDPKGAVLSDAMWQAGIAQIPAGDDLVGARDRAVLMLLFELGLAPEELRMLHVDNILHSAPVGDSGETQIIGVHVEGQRDNQQRKLSVSIALAHGLAHWLRARAQYPAMQGEPALFCSRKSRTLSNHTLLHLVTKTLSEAARNAGLPTPARLGPQIVRNTAIVRWLNAGMPLAEVVERAGLKNVNGLLHLRDLVSEEARTALAQRVRSF